MKQYVIDELRSQDHEKLKTYFAENFGSSSVGDIFWVPIDKDILTPVQAEHVDCQPFYFALDLELNFLACELLVRTKSNIRCDCIGYATQDQRNWLISKVDSILIKLDVIA